MASDKIVHSFPNGADLSAGAGKIVKTATGLVLTSGATDVALGILESNAASTATSGLTLPVVISGLVRAMAGAAITAGAFLKSDSSGKVIATAATTDVIIGQALEAADADGDLILINVNIQAARGS